MIEFAHEILRKEAEAIEKTACSLDSAFCRAVDIILQTEGKVIVSGMGKSGIIGRKIAATFASTGTPSFFIHPAEACHGDLGMIQKNDVLLALSNSGETIEVIKLAAFVKDMAGAVISVTSKPMSLLAQMSHAHLTIEVEEEACPLNLAPTSSTTATVALGDALALTVSREKGFKSQDFAHFHPGGSLGRKLLLPLEEVMHCGERIPIVNEKSSMAKVLAEISEKRFGFTLCVNDSGSLAGIVTDGDLRRAMQQYESLFFSKIASDIMHAKPRTIDRSKTVSDAIELMEKNAITSLVVVENKANIAGIVHLHDLLGRGKVKITV